MAAILARDLVGWGCGITPTDIVFFTPVENSTKKYFVNQVILYNMKSLDIFLKRGGPQMQLFVPELPETSCVVQ
jgi:hypothetical protein